MKKSLFLERTKNISFFENLDDDILEKIASVSSIKEYRKGQILYYENDDIKDIYYILKGSIKFYKVDRFENEIFLYKIDSPRLIYDVSKMSDSLTVCCFANTEFDEDSTIMIIDSTIFRECFMGNDIFMKKILHESFEAIAQFQCIINRDIVFDGTAKVAHFLATQPELFDKLKKHEIAYMLHIQPETLSRILKKLVRNGIISVEKNRLKVLKSNELKKIYK